MLEQIEAVQRMQEEKRQQSDLPYISKKKPFSTDQSIGKAFVMLVTDKVNCKVYNKNVDYA